MEGECSTHPPAKKEKVMKSFKGLLYVTVMLGFTCHTAMAQQSTLYLDNNGAIGNNVSTNANSTGTGSSYSVANGEASSYSNGTASTSTYGQGYYGNQATVTGSTGTSNEGQAFNYSTGEGSGTATSDGTASANLTGSSSYAGTDNLGNGYETSQTLNLAGGIGSNTSIAVNNVGTNGGGAAASSTSGSFDASGYVASQAVPVTSGVGIAVVGGVNDNKASTSNASTSNTITLNNTSTNTNTTLYDNTPVNANAGTNVSASGNYDDPEVNTNN